MKSWVSQDRKALIVHDCTGPMVDRKKFFISFILAMLLSH